MVSEQSRDGWCGEEVAGECLNLATLLVVEAHYVPLFIAMAMRKYCVFLLFELAWRM
jgi:hypothetical protein